MMGIGPNPAPAAAGGASGPAPRLYGLTRRVLAFALGCFYRIDRAGPVLPEGPLLLVGNHPNALVDPGLMIAVSSRPLTFLAKEPIFRMPVLGALVRALGALPVVRAQDDPSRMRENVEALGAAARGLAGGGPSPSSRRDGATPSRRWAR